MAGLVIWVRVRPDAGVTSGETVTLYQARATIKRSSGREPASFVIKQSDGRTNAVAVVAQARDAHQDAFPWTVNVAGQGSPTVRPDASKWFVEVRCRFARGHDPFTPGELRLVSEGSDGQAKANMMAGCLKDMQASCARGAQPAPHVRHASPLPPWLTQPASPASGAAGGTGVVYMDDDEDGGDGPTAHQAARLAGLGHSASHLPSTRTYGTARVSVALGRVHAGAGKAHTLAWGSTPGVGARTPHALVSPHTRPGPPGAMVQSKLHQFATASPSIPLFSSVRSPAVPRGPTGAVLKGFSNLGNTCYMNAILVALLHTPPLARVLLDAGWQAVLQAWQGGLSASRDLVWGGEADTVIQPMPTPTAAPSPLPSTPPAPGVPGVACASPLPPAATLNHVINARLARYGLGGKLCLPYYADPAAAAAAVPAAVDRATDGGGGGAGFRRGTAPEPGSDVVVIDEVEEEEEGTGRDVDASHGGVGDASSRYFEPASMVDRVAALLSCPDPLVSHPLALIHLPRHLPGRYKSHRMLSALHQLVLLKAGGSTVVSDDLARFKQAMAAHNTIFAGSEQQDAHELLSGVLAALTEETEPLAADVATVHGLWAADGVDVVAGHAAFRTLQPILAPSPPSPLATAPPPPPPTPHEVHAALRTVLAMRSQSQYTRYRTCLTGRLCDLRIRCTFTCRNPSCGFHRDRIEVFHDLSVDLPSSASQASSSSPHHPASSSHGGGGAGDGGDVFAFDGSSEEGDGRVAPAPWGHGVTMGRDGGEQVAASRADMGPIGAKRPRPAEGGDGTATPSPRPRHARARVDGDSDDVGEVPPPEDVDGVEVGYVPPNDDDIPPFDAEAHLYDYVPSPGVEGGIQRTFNLGGLLRHFLRPQKLFLRCEQAGCGCDSVLATYAIVSLPRVLFLHLKRFEIDSKTMDCSKRMDRVRFSHTLDLAPICAPRVVIPAPIDLRPAALVQAELAAASPCSPAAAPTASPSAPPPKGRPSTSSTLAPAAVTSKLDAVAAAIDGEEEEEEGEGGAEAVAVGKAGVDAGAMATHSACAGVSGGGTTGTGSVLGLLSQQAWHAVEPVHVPTKAMARGAGGVYHALPMASTTRKRDGIGSRTSSPRDLPPTTDWEPTTAASRPEVSTVVPSGRAPLASAWSGAPSRTSSPARTPGKVNRSGVVSNLPGASVPSGGGGHGGGGSQKGDDRLWSGATSATTTTMGHHAVVAAASPGQHSARGDAPPPQHSLATSSTTGTCGAGRYHAAMEGFTLSIAATTHARGMEHSPSSPWATAFHPLRDAHAGGRGRLLGSGRPGRGGGRSGGRGGVQGISPVPSGDDGGHGDDDSPGMDEAGLAGIQTPPTKDHPAPPGKGGIRGNGDAIGRRRPPAMAAAHTPPRPALTSGDVPAGLGIRVHDVVVEGDEDVTALPHLIAAAEAGDVVSDGEEGGGDMPDGDGGVDMVGPMVTPAMADLWHSVEALAIAEEVGITDAYGRMAHVVDATTHPSPAPKHGGGGGDGPTIRPSYRLQCVVRHEGKQAFRGHYTTDVCGEFSMAAGVGGEDSPPATRSKPACACPWYRYDDSTVLTKTWDDVSGESGQRQAYILVYVLQ